MKTVNGFMPKFRLGHVAPGKDKLFDWTPYEFYHIVPHNVMLVSTYLSPALADYSKESVTRSLASWWDCVEQLVSRKANWVELGGVPVAARLGRERVRELIDQTQRKAKVSVSSDLESALAALQHLGAKTVTIGSRWEADLNEAIATYLADGGIRVVGQTSRKLEAAWFRALSEEEGMNLSFELGREAVALSPQADAVFIPGGRFVITHVIAPLEGEFNKPVLTNFNATIWNALRRTGVVPPIQGWGKLLAT